MFRNVLVVAEKFLCACSNNVFPSSTEFPLPPDPYLFTSLSITNVSSSILYQPEEDFECCDSENDAPSTPALIRSIISFQLRSLEHVVIDLGTEYYYYSSEIYEDGSWHEMKYAERKYTLPDYRQLLSALTDLLKQPQLQSLSVGTSPLTEVRKMIEVFLCTETNHTLSLTIEGTGVDEGKWTWLKSFDIRGDDYDWEWHKEQLIDLDLGNPQPEEERLPTTSCSHRMPPAQPLLVSNGALKSLDIGQSCDCLRTWLLSIPNLQLRELN